MRAGLAAGPAAPRGEPGAGAPRWGARARSWPGWRCRCSRPTGPSSLPDHVALALNVRVLALHLGASVVCALLFGLVPALIGSRTQLHEAMRQGDARMSGGPAPAPGGAGGGRGGAGADAGASRRGSPPGRWRACCGSTRASTARGVLTFRLSVPEARQRTAQDLRELLRAAGGGAPGAAGSRGCELLDHPAARLALGDQLPERCPARAAAGAGAVRRVRHRLAQLCAARWGSTSWRAGGSSSATTRERSERDGDRRAAGARLLPGPGPSDDACSPMTERQFVKSSAWFATWRPTAWWARSRPGTSST